MCFKKAKTVLIKLTWFRNVKFVQEACKIKLQRILLKCRVPGAQKIVKTEKTF